MHALAHGIDLVPVARLARSIGQHGDRFLERVFTSGEREYALANKRRDEHLAARFAAKEAVFKALGTGWSGGIAWTDVEITRDETGRPAIVLAGKAATLAASLGITSWLVSLSHTEDHAIASVIGLG